MKTQIQHFWDSHEHTYSKLRPQCNKSATNPFKVGQRLNYKDLNLRHRLEVMVVVSLHGNSVKVKHTNGIVGEWMYRGLIDHDEWIATLQN